MGRQELLKTRRFSTEARRRDTKKASTLQEDRSATPDFHSCNREEVDVQSRRSAYRRQGWIGVPPKRTKVLGGYEAGGQEKKERRWGFIEERATGQTTKRGIRQKNRRGERENNLIFVGKGTTR